MILRTMNEINTISQLCRRSFLRKKFQLLILCVFVSVPIIFLKAYNTKTVVVFDIPAWNGSVLHNIRRTNISTPTVALVHSINKAKEIVVVALNNSAPPVVTDRVPIPIPTEPLRILPPSAVVPPESLDKLLTRPIINDFEITYVHDQASACKTQPNVRYIIAVPSGPGNFKRREKVRGSQRAAYAKNPANRVKLLFFIGVPSDYYSNRNGTQKKIEAELSKYGDMVQATFVDVYRNITKKSAQMLSWPLTFCPNATFIIRTDDDIDLNATAMIKAVESKYLETDLFVLGNYVRTGTPLRMRASKYHLSRKEYPYKVFPQFLPGGALGLPVKTGGLLLEAMKRFPFIWLDDVFVTGICARRVGVKVFKSPAFHFLHG